MTVTFALTPADFTRLQKVIARRFRQKVGIFSWQFLIRVLVWLCIGLAVAIYARTIREFPELSRQLELVAYLLGAALLAIVATPFVSQAAFRKHMLAPGGAFLSPQTIELSPASISVASVRGDTILPWSGVLALDEDETNYYLFIDTMQALVVPRAAIAPVAAEFEQYTRHLKHAT